MKVAAAAAIAAALILGLAVSGVFGRMASAPPTDTIRLESGPAAPSSPAPGPTTPSPTGSDDPERVDMRVKEEPFDDKGGERRDAERAQEDGNSGSGSANSGSGSGSDED